MGELIYDDSSRLKDWAVERMPDVPVGGDAHTLGLLVDGKLAVVVIYESFTPHMCSMHVVTDNGRRWCSRGFLAAAFAYPFKQLGLSRVTALIPASNTKALNMDVRLGFKPEGVMRKGLGNDDLIVLGMLRDECIWLPKENRHGQ